MLVHELVRTGGRYGLATMCIGVGQGIATVDRAHRRLRRTAQHLQNRLRDAGVEVTGTRPFRGTTKNRHFGDCTHDSLHRVSARLQGRGNLLPRVVLGATAGLLALAVAGPVSAAPPVRAQVHDGVLRVTGTPFADAIQLHPAAGNPAIAEFDVNNDGVVDFSFPTADLSAIVVDGAGGDDRIALDTSRDAFPASLQIVLAGGAGDDELEGGLGHQVLIGGRGNDLIDGNQGADDQFGGHGNDVIVWDPGDGSDLADGGTGFDTLQFNGSDQGEIFHAFQHDGRVTFTRNLGNIVMDAERHRADRPARPRRQRHPHGRRHRSQRAS